MWNVKVANDRPKLGSIECCQGDHTFQVFVGIPLIDYYHRWVEERNIASGEAGCDDNVGSRKDAFKDAIEPSTQRI